MDVNYMIKFKRFLKTNHVYAAYCINRKQHISRYPSLWSTVPQSRPFFTKDISTSFSWANTVQGDDYWLEMSVKWIQYRILNNITT